MDTLEFSEYREDSDWDQVDGHHLVEHYQKVILSISDEEASDGKLPLIGTIVGLKALPIGWYLKREVANKIFD